MVKEFRVLHLGLRIYRFRVQGLGLRVKGLEVRA
jgi:hypothetical protein